MATKLSKMPDPVKVTARVGDVVCLRGDLAFNGGQCCYTPDQLVDGKYIRHTGHGGISLGDLSGDSARSLLSAYDRRVTAAVKREQDALVEAEARRNEAKVAAAFRKGLAELCAQYNASLYYHADACSDWHGITGGYMAFQFGNSPIHHKLED